MVLHSASRRTVVSVCASSSDPRRVLRVAALMSVAVALAACAAPSRRCLELVEAVPEHLAHDGATLRDGSTIEYATDCADGRQLAWICVESLDRKSFPPFAITLQPGAVYELGWCTNGALCPRVSEWPDGVARHRARVTVANGRTRIDPIAD